MLGSIIPSSFLQLIQRTSTSSLMSVPVNPHSPEDCESAPTNRQNGGCPPTFSTEATRTLAFELADELRDGVKDLKSQPTPKATQKRWATSNLEIAEKTNRWGKIICKHHWFKWCFNKCADWFEVRPTLHWGPGRSHLHCEIGRFSGPEMDGQMHPSPRAKRPPAQSQVETLYSMILEIQYSSLYAHIVPWQILKDLYLLYVGLLGMDPF